MQIYLLKTLQNFFNTIYMLSTLIVNSKKIAINQSKTNKSRYIIKQP